MKKSCPPIYAWIPLFFILAFAAFDRLYRIREIGLDGSDQTYYWLYAKAFYEGARELTDIYRPVAYLLNELKMHIFGVTQYALRNWNAALDVVNVALIYWLGLKLFRNWWIAPLASLTYAVIPAVVSYSRTELVHIDSVCLILLSVIAFTDFLDSMKFQRNRSLIMLGLSGLMSGLAANIHPDLLFFLPSYLILLCLLWMGPLKNRRDLYPLTYLFGSFLIGFLTPFLIASYFFGMGAVLDVMLSNRKDQGHSMFIWWGFTTAFILCSSILTVLAFYANVALLGVLKFKREPVPFIAIALLVLIFGYTCFHVLLVSRFQIHRCFLPLIPLVILFIYLIQEVWAEYADLRYRAAPVLIIALALIAFERNQYHKGVFISTTQDVSVPMEVYQKLEKHVDSEHRVLFAPLIFYNDRWIFRSPAYFGTNAQYLIASQETTLEDVLKNQKIAYVVVSQDYIAETIPRDNDREFKERLKVLYGRSPEDYNFKWEIGEFIKFVNQKGMSIFEQNPRFQIFALKE